jgi:DNA-binding NarL/FixJ family response regulator
MRVFVLDDHDVVRRSLKELLEADRERRSRSRGRHSNQMSRCSMSACPTAAAWRSAVRFAHGTRRSNASCSARSPMTRRSSSRSWRARPAMSSSRSKGGDIVNAVRLVASGESLFKPALRTRVLDEGPERERGAQAVPTQLDSR